MKKIILIAVVFFVVANTLQAQLKRPLKKVMELKMTPKSEADDFAGTRGASVVWHPLQKKYYVSFAGNMGYPMAVFSAIGKRLSADNLTTMIDTRGLWYNPLKKQICGNGYDTNGWFSYTFDAKGMPKENTVNFEGMNQPDAQSVGAYNPTKKQVLFLKGSQIWVYKATAEVEDTTVIIHWGLTAKDGIAEDEDITTVPEGYNNSTLIYSGVPGAEVGVLNVVDKQIELYNYKTGFLSQKLKLPETATTELMFNFSFSNGIYWLFDMETRVWTGYK